MGLAKNPIAQIRKHKPSTPNVLSIEKSTAKPVEHGAKAVLERAWAGRRVTVGPVLRLWICGRIPLVRLGHECGNST